MGTVALSRMTSPPLSLRRVGDGGLWGASFCPWLCFSIGTIKRRQSCGRGKKNRKLGSGANGTTKAIFFQLHQPAFDNDSIVSLGEEKK